MGLDMYAYRMNGKLADYKMNGYTLPTDAINDHLELIAYWRKHNALHGFFLDKWLADDAGNVNPDDFNCLYFPVTLVMLDELEARVKSGALTQREGFFWGSYDISEECRDDDLKFIEDARAAIRAGDVVLYSCWW